MLADKAAKFYHKKMDGARYNTKKIVIAIVVVAVVAAAIWYWYAGKRPEPVKTAEDAIEALSAPALNVESNPVEGKVPELNPIDRANPFKDAYKNPFESR